MTSKAYKATPNAAMHSASPITMQMAQTTIWLGANLDYSVLALLPPCRQ